MAFHSKCVSVAATASTMSTVKSQLRKMKDNILQTQEEIKKNLGKKKSKVNDETARYLQFESDIRALSHKAMGMIKSKEKLLVDELKSISEKHVRQYQVDISSDEMSIERCQKQVERIDQALQSDSDTDVYMLYQGAEAGDAVPDADLRDEDRIAKITLRQDKDQLFRALADLQLGEIDVRYEMLDLKASAEIQDTSNVLDPKAIPKIQGTSSVLDSKSSPEIQGASHMRNLKTSREIEGTSHVSDPKVSTEMQGASHMRNLKTSPEIEGTSHVFDPKVSTEIQGNSNVLEQKGSPEVQGQRHQLNLKAIPEIQGTTHSLDLKATPKIQGTSHLLDLKATPVLLETLNVRTAEDRNKALLIDITVIIVNDTNTVIITDYSNKSVKSFYTRNDKPCYSRLSLDCDPWSVTQLTSNQMAVTVPKIKQIVIVEASPDMSKLSTISTSKQYRGITALTASTIAVSTMSPPGVDVLDSKGNMLRSSSLIHHSPSILKYPYFLSLTNTGNILVADSGTKNILCLKPDGDIVFSSIPTGDRSRHGFQGIITTTTGDILVTYFDLNSVVHLTGEGQFVKTLLTEQDGIDKPRGLCVGGDGRVYICNSFKGQIKVFKC